MKEAERLTLLVEELLVLARLDAGQERGPTETVCLNELAQEAARRHESSARERHVSVTLEASPSVHAMVARGSVSLVLVNLLDNALKSSPLGSHVSLRLATQADQATPSVADTGPVLQRNELARLFERFYRGSAARAGAAPGGRSGSGAFAGHRAGPGREHRSRQRRPAAGQCSRSGAATPLTHRVPPEGSIRVRASYRARGNPRHVGTLGTLRTD
jgi:hypothetical protein